MPNWPYASRLSSTLKRLLVSDRISEREGSTFHGAEVFGEVARCREIESVLTFMRGLPLLDNCGRISAVAYGMTLIAALNIKENSTFYEGQESLNQLSRAKSTLDIACGHDPSIVEVTANLLSAAQHFVDSATVPCTEWASTQEIFEVVYRCAECEITPNHSEGLCNASSALL